MTPATAQPVGRLDPFLGFIFCAVCLLASALMWLYTTEFVLLPDWFPKDVP